MKKRPPRPPLTKKVADREARANSDGGGPLPDFELARLESVEHERLRSQNGEEREIDALMLALALVFNDLKDFLWFFGRLSPGNRHYPSAGAHPQRGQVSGMSLRVIRSIAATLHELLKLLEEKKHVVQGVRFATIVRLLTSEASQKWAELNELARGSAKGRIEPGSIGAMLKSVRDKSGSHYAAKELQEGYAAHFAAGADDPRRERAYYSDGENMERTRFYFADAAAEGWLQSELHMTRKEFEDHLYQHVEHVNNVLKWLLTAWLHTRGGTVREATMARAEAAPKR